MADPPGLDAGGASMPATAVAVADASQARCAEATPIPDTRTEAYAVDLDLCAECRMVTSRSLWSLGLHAHATVDADDLGVHVAVAEQLDGHARELVGGAEALGEEHVALELLLELLAGLALAVDRRVDEAGRDAVHPDSDRGQVAGDRQRDADHAALRRRVARLADLAVEGSHGGDRHDRAPLAVGQGLGLRHGRGRQPDAVERAQEVHLDDLLEVAEVVGRLVLAVLADGARGPAEPGRGDERPQRAELLCRFHRGDDLLGVGDVAGREHAVDLLGERLALVLLAVEGGGDDPGAPARGGAWGGGPP